MLISSQNGNALEPGIPDEFGVLYCSFPIFLVDLHSIGARHWLQGQCRPGQGGISGFLPMVSRK